MARDPKEKAQKPSTQHRDTAEQRQLIERRRNRGNADPAEYAHVDAKLLLRAVTAVTSRGFAIQFGYTSDRGAFRLRLVGGGEASDEYVRPTEDINHYLESLCLDFEL